MPYTILPDGRILTDSAEDAIALSRKLTEPRPTPPRPASAPAPIPKHTSWNISASPVPAPTPETQPSPDADRANQALSFLSAVQQAGSKGVGTEQMMRIFETDKPRALGAKTFTVANTLKSANIEPSKAYVGKRTKQGTVFTPGPAIAEAIEAMNKGANGGLF